MAQPGYNPSVPGAAPGQMPNTGQPAQFMTRPAAPPGCPNGLEYLTQVDQLLVHQQVEVIEVLTSWEAANKYEVKNSVGQRVYFAAEDSDACARQCCGANRGFTMHITDNMGQEIIRVQRPLKVCSGANCCACLGCCAQECTIEAPPGTVVGSVRQTQSCLAPKYEILDAGDNHVLNIEGPICVCQGPCCTGDQEFKVMSKDGAHEVGKVSKQWTGLVREMFTDADNFGVTFPMDLDVKIKAVLLGSVFLIDFMFFEQKANKDQHHHH